MKALCKADYFRLCAQRQLSIIIRKHSAALANEGLSPSPALKALGWLLR
jgi:hypothetical protein